ncbi:MAG TPA: DbpA RNA binding domain-containing protein [Gemmatimonadales bacterium]|nr:DbpA RNA binding domain-containing protein [Gemmatimonadales bacterium]
MTDPNAQATVARGHNLVVFAPPSPAATGFVLAGMIERLESGSHAAPGLALAPSEAIPEWTRIAHRLGEGHRIRIAGARTPARLTRLLQHGAGAFLFASPPSALEATRRAALRPETIPAILIVWPEFWGDDGNDVVAALFQDLPKETQRVIVTTSPEDSRQLIERFGWRAPISDHLGATSHGPLSPTPARTVPAAWERRIPTITDLVEELDPASLAIWTAVPEDHAEIRRGLEAAGIEAVVMSAPPPPASLVVADDLPAPAELRELSKAGEVLLMVPPGTESYAARIAPGRRPLNLRKVLDRARAEDDRARRRIADVLDRGSSRASILALAPLLERFDATAVAAAAFELWQQAERAPGPTRPAPGPAASARLWVGVGRRDGATPHDLVATLTRECGVSKEAIGRIEIRESFALIEIADGGETDLETVAERLTGKTIRKRRLVAKLDRKR